MGYPLILNEITLPSTGQAPVPVNENYKVDVNRGVLIRFTRTTQEEFPAGMAVYMYLERPGVFYNDHAKPVPPALAAAAGYDIEPLLKARRKQEALAKAKQEIESQFRGEVLRETVLEEGEYRLVHVGNGQHIVEFEDGSSLTPIPVSRVMAEKTYWAMLGKEPPPKAK